MANNTLIIGKNDLATVNPEVAKTLHPTLNENITAQNVSANSHKKLWWICEHGHIWEASVYNRNRGRGCPVCAGKVVVTGVNDFGSNFPELLSEWDYKKNKELDPFQIAQYSCKSVWWVKKAVSPASGKLITLHWKDTLAHRATGRGCPYESGRGVYKGFNDLLSCEPEIASEWDYEKNGDLTPDMFSSCSKEKVWWKCEKCGHSWLASMDNRVRKQTGCPKCNESKGEKAVATTLDELGIVFEREYKFADCCFNDGTHPLRLDFALMCESEVIGAIEYHGIQHYEPVDFGGQGAEIAFFNFESARARDEVKSNYLKSKNIPQLIIPYTEFENIESIVKNFVGDVYTTEFLVA